MGKTNPQKAVALSLSRREVVTLIRLLGKLQDHLESAIESCMVPGTNKVSDLWEKRGVAIDRKDWRQAETFVSKLELLRK
jgi:hypothetical protein